MLSTGYNCRDVLNIGLMRPIFSPTEYIQIKGRGTRRFTFKIGHTEYEKKNFFLLDFCAVWPAPGSEDTELGVLMGPEVRHGEAEVYARVQA
jgi:type I site-specific restriction endonuclease